jgi:hypothetical protein
VLLFESGELRGCSFILFKQLFNTKEELQNNFRKFVTKSQKINKYFYGVIEEKSFWSYLFLKKLLIRILECTHRRYRFNELQMIEGSEII